MTRRVGHSISGRAPRWSGTNGMNNGPSKPHKWLSNTGLVAEYIGKHKSQQHAHARTPSSFQQSGWHLFQLRTCGLPGTDPSEKGMHKMDVAGILPHSSAYLYVNLRKSLAQKGRSFMWFSSMANLSWQLGENRCYWQNVGLSTSPRPLYRNPRWHRATLRSKDT
jgi:hypothetical protein